MAEYKLSYTASEIDEKLGKIDELESAIENIGSAGGGSGLPAVATEDNHSIMQVVDGEWQKVEQLCYSEISDFSIVMNGVSVTITDGQAGSDKEVSIETKPIDGEFYTLVIDEESYETTCTYLGYDENDGHVYMFGNKSLWVNGMPDTGEPFFILLVTPDESSWAFNMAATTDGTYGVGIIQGAMPIFILDDTLTFADDGSGLYTWLLESETSIGEIRADKTYSVYIDMTQYRCVAQTSPYGFTYIGNLSLLGFGENTGESFVLMYGVQDGVYMYQIYTTDTQDTHQVEIIELGEKIKPLDEKYLPKDAIIAMIDAYMEEALGGDY